MYAIRGGNYNEKTICSHLIYSLLLPALPVSAASFEDVPPVKYSWATEAIDSLTSQDIIKGYADGSFKPANTVTENELFTLIDRIAPGALEDYELAYLTQGKNKKLNRWETLIIVDAAFGEDWEPERADLDAAMAKAKDIKQVIKSREWHKEAHDDVFTPTIAKGNFNGPLDIVNYAEWQKARAMLNMFTAGYMTPSNTGMFYPKQPVTRAEIATILYRVMQSQ